MLDKIRGKKEEEDKDKPDLRGNNKKKSSSDIGGRLKGMVNRVSRKKDDDKKDEMRPPSDRKAPRPMPKPIAKPGERPRLKPPQKKPESKKSGIGSAAAGAVGGFGRKGPIPDDDQKTLVGAAVFGLILIILVGAGYYFLVYSPYQDAMGDAKQSKINEVKTYFKGPLATDPRGIDLRLQIDSAETPEQVLAIDVLGPATQAWREYQTQQIESQKDPYGRVMVAYAANNQKNIILKVSDAQKLVNEADASVLSNMEIKTPDTVAIPMIISRLQAAGGLINVGNSVDVYLMNATPDNSTNSSVENNTPSISGATVLAILRARDSGVITANISRTQDIAINQLIQSSSRSQGASSDVEQLLRGASARVLDDSEIRSLLDNYGLRLSDFERQSNLGELDAQYLVLLEVPRENAIFLIRNMNNVILTVPTQQAPEWMIRELSAIYG
ncbi:DUF515 domain-containing protein [Methanobacterium sp. ACI-7]|uniref:DUF515 domain-containing protein n=1 Tax=unclassified Methanobacterium TaxID=2627676 RepID=UPI0039C42463